MTSPRYCTLACSFCGKDESFQEVDTIVCGPAVYICNECIDLCVDILARVRAEGRLTMKWPNKRRCHGCRFYMKKGRRKCRFDVIVMDEKGVCIDKDNSGYKRSLAKQFNRILRG